MKYKHSDSSQAFELKNLKLGNFMFMISKTFSQHTITRTIRHTKTAQTTTYSFEVKTTYSGYHVCKNTTLVNANEGDEVSVDIEANKESIKVDPYACAIYVKNKYFDATKTVGHIPREVS